MDGSTGGEDGTAAVLVARSGMAARRAASAATMVGSQKLDFFSALPPELALYVVSFLAYRDLCSLARVSSLCRSMAYDDELWRSMYIRTWGLGSLNRAEVRLPLCGGFTSWRVLFVSRMTLEWDFCSVDANAQPEAMESEPAGGEDQKPKKTPPKPIEIRGRGRYKDKTLLVPVGGRGWLSWGHIMQKRVEELRSERTKEKGGERTDEYFRKKRSFHEQVTRLLVMACEEYQTSVAVTASVQTPDAERPNILYVSNNNWGISLAELARFKHGPLSDMLFLRAYDKLAHTAQLRQGYNDLWWVLSEWAVTLRAHAARKMSEGTTMLVANAKGTEYETVDALFEQSCKKLAEAHKLLPADSQILSEWADGLSEHATSKIAATSRSRQVLSPDQLEQAQRLFRESYIKYEESLELAVDRGHDRDIVLSNYGLALSDHAMIADPAQAKDLFALSFEKYHLAASIKPDNVLTQCNLAMTFVLHSYILSDQQERERLWVSAEEILNKQLEKSDYWTYFCMARLSAVRGRHEDCRKWLEMCARKNYLAKRTKWFCVHFATVKNLPWFKSLKKIQVERRKRERDLLADVLQ